jgi:hypothetical protein
VGVPQDVQRARLETGSLALAAKRLSEPLRVNRAAERVEEHDVVVDVGVAGERPLEQLRLAVVTERVDSELSEFALSVADLLSVEVVDRPTPIPQQGMHVSRDESYRQVLHSAAGGEPVTVPRQEPAEPLDFEQAKRDHKRLVKKAGLS